MQRGVFLVIVRVASARAYPTVIITSEAGAEEVMITDEGISG